MYSCKRSLALLAVVSHLGDCGLFVCEKAQPKDMDSEDADTMTVECGGATGGIGGVTGLGMFELKRGLKQGLKQGLYDSGVRQSVSGSESLSELVSEWAAVVVLDVLGAVG